MKKCFIFAAVLGLFVACDRSKVEDPTPQQDEKNMYVAGLYKDSLNQQKIYLCEEQTDVYTNIEGTDVILRTDGSAMYSMVLNGQVCNFYKDTTLKITVPFYAMDFYVENGNITAVGAANLDLGFPAAITDYNAVQFSSVSENITFLDNQEYSTSKASYICKENNNVYIGGYAFLTSSAQKVMAWLNSSYENITAVQYPKCIAVQNGKFVVIGTKSYGSGKSVVAMNVNDVETIISDTATAVSSSVFISDVLSAKVFNNDLYICATENFNNDIRVIIWKNGVEYITYPSTLSAVFTVKGTELFSVTKGKLGADPYILRNGATEIKTLPTNVTSITDICIK